MPFMPQMIAESLIGAGASVGGGLLANKASKVKLTPAEQLAQQQTAEAQRQGMQIGQGQVAQGQSLHPVSRPRPLN